MAVPAAALGRRRLAVSRLGLGLAAVGRPAYITLGRAADLPRARTPEALYERTAALLDVARAAGVRYVDAARSYGRAEEFLARWLAERTVPPDAITVGSKWGYRYTAGWTLDAKVHEEKELSCRRFEAQLAESRALLGDRLALYQIHSATADSGALTDEALLGALVGARRSGAFRAVGVTLSGPESARTLELVLSARFDDEPVFDVVQATFNCLEPSLGPLLARAHEGGLGVIAKEVFANGRLTAANDRPDDVAVVGRLRALAEERGCGIDQLVLAFALSRPFVDVALSGAATTAQLAGHVQALDLRLDARAAAVLERLAEPPARYWTTRAGLAWS